MRRTDKTGKRGVTLVLASLAVLALVLISWREWNHGRHQRALQESREALAALLATTEASLTASREEGRLAQSSLEELAITLQTLRDRIANLEAQRNHLRAENDRMNQSTEMANTALETAEGALAQARLEVLEQSALPRELRSERDAAYARISTLEQSLDERMAQLAGSPNAFLFEGISSDESVFALSGAVDGEIELPMPVHLYQTGGLILDGWLARLEEDAIIGHVERWRSPSSALVKGEKVFILPRTRHEKDR